MNTKNAATRQDVVTNSVDHQISSLASSATSPKQLETLLSAELDHDLIAWPRQYLEIYLDSDATGRVPLDAEQLQDVLEAAFDRDAAIARASLEELNGERGPKRLGGSTLQVTITRSEGKETEYELLFDPTDAQDLSDLIEKLDRRVSERQKAEPSPTAGTRLDTRRRESTAFVVAHEPGSSAVELRDKATGTTVRKLLDADLPPTTQSALQRTAPGTRMENAQTDSGTYRGEVVADTEKNLIQQITPQTAIVHRKELLDSIPAVGEHVRIIYSSKIGRVASVRERSKSQELGR